MQTHELKIDPAMFLEVIARQKTWEFRKTDRDYQKGDTVVLREYDRSSDTYSGCQCIFVIGFILRGPDYGLPLETAILSITQLEI